MSGPGLRFEKETTSVIPLSESTCDLGVSGILFILKWLEIVFSPTLAEDDSFIVFYFTENF